MLIKNIEELKAHASFVNKNMSFNTLISYVDQAEFKYLMPYVGFDTLAGLEAVDLAGTTNTPQKQLLKMLRTAVAHYAMMDAAPFMNLQFGDAGIVENSNTSGGPARQWAYFNFIDAAVTNADVFLDMALEFMDINPGAVPHWQESEAYKNGKALLINSTGDLSRFLNIQKSRRAFITLMPYIKRAEEFYIEPVLGEALYEELKSAVLLPITMTAEQKKLLDLVRPCLAQYVLIEAIPEISFTVTGSGLKVLSDNDGIRQRLAINKDDRNDVVVSATKRAERYLEALRNYLDTKLQEGETDPADNDQSYRPFINTQESQAFFIG